jgi:large subunit ribosomal protein L25
VRQIIEHLDLVIVRKGEKVTIDIPVHLEGEALPGTQVLQDANTLSIEAEATNIPERLIVSIEGLGEGTHITASQIKLPEGSSLISDPDVLVVGITSATAADLGESAEEEGAEEGAEGDAEASAEDASAAEESAE